MDHSPDERRQPLLDRRIPRERIELGRAYFLFEELDWDEGEPFGTATPLRLLEGDPPSGDAVGDDATIEARGLDVARVDVGIARAGSTHASAP